MTVEQRFFLKTENVLQKYKINCINKDLNYSNKLIKEDNVGDYRFIIQDFSWDSTTEGFNFWDTLRAKWLRNL